jgi:hypothetical protein
MSRNQSRLIFTIYVAVLSAVAAACSRGNADDSNTRTPEMQARYTQTQFDIREDKAAAKLLLAILQNPRSAPAKRQLAQCYSARRFEAAAVLLNGAATIGEAGNWQPPPPLPSDRFFCADATQKEIFRIAQQVSRALDRSEYDAVLRETSAVRQKYPLSCYLAFARAEALLLKAESGAPVDILDQEWALRVLCTSAGETEFIPARHTSHAAVFVAIAQYFSARGDVALERAAYLLAAQQATLRANREFIGATEGQIRKHLQK